MSTTLQKFSIAGLDRVYYAEACEPIVAASEEGTIEIQALARYFATVFNEHHHCTPQQFREQVAS